MSVLVSWLLILCSGISVLAGLLSRFYQRSSLSLSRTGFTAVPLDKQKLPSPMRKAAEAPDAMVSPKHYQELRQSLGQLPVAAPTTAFVAA